MIGLVRLLPPPDGRGTVLLHDLPHRSAHLQTGYLVRCLDTASVDKTLTWYGRLLERRPTMPLGLVARPEVCARALARFPAPIDPLITPDELIAGGVSMKHLEAIRSHSLEGAILQELVSEHGDHILANATTVKALISRAVDGGTLKAVARDLNVHVQTVHDRLEAVGLDPRRTKSFIRVRCYYLRIRLGVKPAEALLAGGWTSQEARRKCLARVRNWGYSIGNSDFRRGDSWNSDSGPWPRRSASIPSDRHSR